MKVNVRLHGILRDRLPAGAKGRIVIDLPGNAHVADVVAQLALEGPLHIAYNETVIDDFGLPLHDGDTLEIFLPVAGGS